jgi:hypothetical protein
LIPYLPAHAKRIFTRFYKINIVIKGETAVSFIMVFLLSSTSSAAAVRGPLDEWHLITILSI